MKVYLRWFTASVILGGVLTLFWAPENTREACYFMLFGTGFWCAMLLPMLNAEE